MESTSHKNKRQKTTEEEEETKKEVEENQPDVTPWQDMDSWLYDYYSSSLEPCSSQTYDDDEPEEKHEESEDELKHKKARVYTYDREDETPKQQHQEEETDSDGEEVEHDIINGIISDLYKQSTSNFFNPYGLKVL